MVRARRAAAGGLPPGVFVALAIGAWRWRALLRLRAAFAGPGRALAASASPSSASPARAVPPCAGGVTIGRCSAAGGGPDPTSVLLEAGRLELVRALLGDDPRSRPGCFEAFGRRRLAARIVSPHAIWLEFPRHGVTPPPELGAPCPDFRLPAVDGKRYARDDFADKPVLEAGLRQGVLERGDRFRRDARIRAAEEAEDRVAHLPDDVDRGRDVRPARTDRAAVEADGAGEVEAEDRAQEGGPAAEAEADDEQGLTRSSSSIRRVLGGGPDVRRDAASRLLDVGHVFEALVARARGRRSAQYVDRGRVDAVLGEAQGELLEERMQAADVREITIPAPPAVVARSPGMR
jgi:hypothetical protein